MASQLTSLATALVASVLLARVACAQSARVVATPPLLNSSGYYVGNRVPLKGSPFQKLPAGAVKPGGWLKGQLDLDASGIVGRMGEISNYVKFAESGWVNPKSDVGWEEVAYWLRGYGDLGYVLGNASIQANAKKWLNGILRNQKPDGYFGPEKLRTSIKGLPDLWPHMLMLDALRSYYEFSGDVRVLPFMTRYFKWQSTVPSATFKSGGFRACRWADNTDSIYWLYNRTGDAFLLDLAKKIHDNSENFTDGVPSLHNVNIAQGIREPGQYWMQSGEARHLNAVEKNYQSIMAQYGQFPGGGFAGDELIRPGFGDPRQGFETCGFVEFMHTHEMMTRISGNPLWADRAEEIAFNSLPAALTPNHKGIHYITSANMVQLDLGANTGQFTNRWSMLEFEPGANTYRCCPHNYSMAWPYYAEESWLATSDKGVAASLYGASEASVRVGDGTEVRWSETTAYPFGETVDFKLSTPKAVQFPFYLRIPRWTKNAEIRVNGKKVEVVAKPLAYVVLDRMWNNGDTVSLRLPMQVELRKWSSNMNSVSVSYGPLQLAFNPGEKWAKTGGTPAWPNEAVTPVGAWNYGLPQNVKASDFVVDVKSATSASANQPFTLENVPISLKVKARRVPGWGADSRGIVRVLQASPALSNEPLESITLVPSGAARLRITLFPTVSSRQDALDWSLILPVHNFTMSTSFGAEDPEVMVDGLIPTASNDSKVPRFTWWNHLGTTESVSLDFKSPQRISSASVYWFDDTGTGKCRVPASWRLLYRDGGAEWKPVPNASAYGVARDQFNSVSFAPLMVTGLRIEAQLQPNVSAGILEWKTDAK
ncbi:transcriptional initiation protein Tat [bacterium]|nr:MAG: transcriptional initiation protein Tat [bacterium]